MKFITVDQFKGADKKVQNAILEWWKPSVGDLVYDKDNVIDRVMPNLCIGDYKDNLDKSKVIPLLTEGQLREFIEDKTNSKVIFEYTCMGHIVVKLLKENKTNGSLECNYKVLFQKCNLEIIEALWKVASYKITQNNIAAE